MNRFKFDVSLRVRHPSLDVMKICSEIGMTAYRKWSVGEPRETPKGKKLNGFYDETYCTFKLEHEGDEEISSFLKRQNSLLKDKSDFFDMIIATGGNIEYFIGWYLEGNTGDVFTHDLITELSELGFSLSIDLYP